MSLTQQQCEQFWNSADKNGDGFLTIQELAAALKGYRTPGFMFNSIDKSGDHKVSREEFFDEMSKPSRSQTLKDTFTSFDKDENGSLSRSELEAVVRASKCFKPEEIPAAINEIFDTADINHDGSVSLDEFLKACS